jgi:hypothetical protein
MGMTNKFFDRQLRPGDPVSRRGLVKALNAMDKAWATLDVSGGYVDWSPDGRPLIVAGAGSANRLRPFRVRRATTDGEVTVADGMWEYTESSDDGGGDVTIRRYSLGGDQTITSGDYILLCLERTEDDPDDWTLSVSADSSLPSGSGSNSWWKLLAVDNSDTPGTDPAEVEEKWFGGNLHTFFVVTGTTIPTPSGSDPGVLVYDPNDTSIKWIYSDTLYKVLQRMSGDVLGFDWTRAHS